MARRKRRRIRKNALDYVALPRFDLDPETKKGIFIVLILALGAISLLSLFNLAGAMGVYLAKGLVLAFGWGKWIVPIILLALGFFLYNDDKYYIGGANYLGIFLFLISSQTILQFFVDTSEWQKMVSYGVGGGYFGLFLATQFLKLLGFWGGLLAAFCLLLISFMLTFNASLASFFGRESWIAKFFIHPIKFIFSKIFNREYKEDNEEIGYDDEEDDEEEEINEPEVLEDDEEEGGEETVGFEKHALVSEEEPEFMKEAFDDKGKVKKNPPDGGEGKWTSPHVKIDLPLNLLNAKVGKPTSGDIKNNMIIIEQALKNFGIEVDMGEVSVGPTVTQYTFKPRDGVKLARITNLSNDLALALAAHPIRIEAPIPGKALVGVEVPNQVKAVVGLREVLSNKEFKERKNNLILALGRDVSGKSWMYDLAKMPHLLVAGATNSGKSVCLNTIIVSLLYQNNPDDLRFIMVDPKRVELPVYNGIPHLLTPVITEVSKTINALKWCLNEMDRRFEVLSKNGKRNIESYNISAKNADSKMPYIVFIIDELADLMVAAGRDIEAAVIRLAQMSRAVGIHLVLATQRPSVDVITGLIKANMPARIAFSVASGTDSRTILDSLGAEKLLGRGDMLFVTAELSKPKRLQGAFVSEEEIKKIVRYIKSESEGTDYVEGITERQKVRGVAGVGMDGESDDDDELLSEAKELIINSGKASASYLQRRLSVGYARAARLLDILEEMGVIGPSNGSRPREILISKEQYDNMLTQGVSGVALHNRDEAEAPAEFLNSEDDEEIEGIDEDEVLEDSSEELEEDDESEEDNPLAGGEEEIEEDEVSEIRKDEKRDVALKADKEKQSKSIKTEDNEDEPNFFAR